MIIFGVIFAIIFLFLLIVLHETCRDNDDVKAAAALGAALFVLFLASLVCFSEYFRPSIEPIDVYQGRTTLEITYKNGIAIDSVVVWKEE